MRAIAQLVLLLYVRQAMEFPNVESVLNSFRSQYPNAARIIGDVVYFDSSYVFTKGPSAPLNAVFKVDREVLKTATKVYITRINKETLVKRLSSFQLSNTPPQHLPLQLIKGFNLEGLKGNVFLPFPYAYNKPAKQEENIFGFEFVDRSQQIWFNEVTPRVLKHFVNGQEIVSKIAPLIREITYIYAVLHEKAHMAGSFSVLNTREDEIGMLVPGVRELIADLIAFNLGQEITEVSVVVFLMRLFWYLARNPMLDDPDVIALVPMLNIASLAINRTKEGLKLDPEVLGHELSHQDKLVSFLNCETFIENRDLLNRWWQDQLAIAKRGIFAVFLRGVR